MSQLQPCGTRAAYVRHKNAGQDPCDPCVEANRAASRTTSAATRARHATQPRPARTRRNKTSDGMSAAWQWEPIAVIDPYLARQATATVTRHVPATDVPGVLAALGIEQVAA